MESTAFAQWEAALEARGFRRVETATDAAFGNEMVVLARQDLRLRYVRDRGQGSVDLASPEAPEEWFDAAIVMEMFGRLSAKQPTSVEQQMTTLFEALEDVARAFREENFRVTRRRLETLENERVRSLFGGLLRRK